MRSCTHTHPSHRLTYNVEQKFNLTYWSTDFHGENADCRREGDKNLSFIWLTLLAPREKKKKKKKLREEEREDPFNPAYSSVRRSPSNRTLHLFIGEMRLDSISRSIWFRREGASQPISGVLVGNVYHLLAVRTYALCGSVIRSPGEKHKQLMVGRWRSDGGREASGEGGDRQTDGEVD